MSEPQSTDPKAALPLVVDLDGSLLRTDSLVESILDLARRHPLHLFVLPIWILPGRAAFKRRLAEYTSLDVATLPYHAGFLEYLRQQHALGRRLVLATGADQSIARAVADHLGIFDEVIGSDGTRNYSGRAKREELNRRFGAKNYVYAGNARIDLHVWRDAGAAVLVACSPILMHRASSLTGIEKNFPTEHAPGSMSQAMRLGRLVLNLLVFVPLFSKNHPHKGLALFLAFIAFCFMSSSVYLLDDLLNLKKDRRDDSRRFRPFADGRASLLPAVALAVALFAVAFAVAGRLPVKFVAILALYFVAALGYALFLRGVPVLGTLVQFALLALRIMGGYSAI